VRPLVYSSFCWSRHFRTLDYFFEFSDTISSPIVGSHCRKERDIHLPERKCLNSSCLQPHPQPSIHGLAVEIYHNTQFVPLAQKKE
jgi:hypothetical protein